MWFFYALSSALLASFRKVNDKHLSHAVNHLHLAWMTKASSLPLLGIMAIATQQLWPSHALSPAFWTSTLLCALVATPLDTAVYLQSLKHGQLSKTAPLLTLWPVVMVIIGVVVLGQVPSAMAVLAILLIVASVYVLNTSRGHGNVFRNIWTDRGTRFGLIGVGTVAFNTTLGAIGVMNSSPLFFAFWAGLGAVITQLILAQIIAPNQFRHAHMRMLIQNGVIQCFATATYLQAVSIGPIGYVSAVRSLASPLSAVLGARVFREGLGRRKVAALVCIVIGAILLGAAA